MLSMMAFVYFAGACLLILGGILTLHIRRSLRLQRRQRLPIGQLLDMLCAECPDQRRTLRLVLRRLAYHLRINEGVLRCTDRFDQELRLAPHWVGLPDLALDMFSEDLEGILRKKRGAAPVPRIRFRGTSLKDLAGRIRVALSREDSSSDPTEKGYA